MVSQKIKINEAALLFLILIIIIHFSWGANHHQISKGSCV